MRAACGLGVRLKGRTSGGGSVGGMEGREDVLMEVSLITEEISRGMCEAFTGVSCRNDGSRTTVVTGSSFSFSESGSEDDGLVAVLCGMGMLHADIINRLRS
jgi:hypothetical protein